MFQYVMVTGKIMVFGVSPEDGQITVSPYDIFRRDLQIIGSFSICNTHRAALDLLESGVVKVKPLISHTLPLDRFEEGLKLAMNRTTSLKVQINPWMGGYDS
jgi:threonine dehydrogenase-like Zn-dependent dehydrogenase